MPKALTIQRSTVPATERTNYTKRLKTLHSHYTAANCRFWVFEETSLPGAYVEFFEASDVDVLQGAHEGTPGSIEPSARTYKEVELT